MKRWILIIEDRWEAKEDEHHGWVMFEDVAQLERDYEATRAINVRLQAEVDKSRHSFKNFHRALCERFDYCHDEKDWERDQVSLMEWIAKRIAAPVSAQEGPGVQFGPEAKTTKPLAGP